MISLSILMGLSIGIKFKTRQPKTYTQNPSILIQLVSFRVFWDYFRISLSILTGLSIKIKFRI